MYTFSKDNFPNVQFLKTQNSKYTISKSFFPKWIKTETEKISLV